MNNSSTQKWRGWRGAIAATASIVLAASALAGCSAGDGGDSSGEAGDGQTTGPLTPIFGEGGPDSGQGIEFNLGVNAAVSGIGASIGQDMLSGAELASELILASGGPNLSVGVSDHDNGSVPASISGVRKLISQDKIQALITSYGAATTAIFPLVQQDEVLTFWSGGAGAQGEGQDFIWTSMALFAVDVTPGALNYIVENYPDTSRLALVGQQENGLSALTEVAPEIWPEVSDGGTITGTDFADIGTTDFSSIIARLKSQNAQAILTTLYGADLGYFVKQVRDAGIDIPIMLTDFVQPTVQEIAGDALNDEVFLALDAYVPAGPSPLNKIFVEAYQEKYGKEPNFFAANMFEATLVVWQLIVKAVADGEDPTGAVLQEQLKAQPNFPSVYGGSADTNGELIFDPESHLVSKPMGIFKVSIDGIGEKLATLTAGSTELGAP
ncbi:ABC transporter substrate-binding protein [Microbacterium sp. BR1]|uniref:ABC transporter substrate-binding protein n=1 Tax=Microbacterium sp. BR1 TaxID=1070896 RepID=UPI000C2C2AB0|nr:ABC transporter substrate-binding protein [Microbacterium sp. BR1]